MGCPQKAEGYLACWPRRKSKEEIRYLPVDSNARFNSVYSFSRGDSIFESISSGEAALIREDICPIGGVFSGTGRAIKYMPITITRTDAAAASEGIRAGLRDAHDRERVFCLSPDTCSGRSGIAAMIFLFMSSSKLSRMACLSWINFGLRDVQNAAYSRHESHRCRCLCKRPDIDFPESNAWDIFHLYIGQNILLLLIIRMKIYGRLTSFPRDSRMRPSVPFFLPDSVGLYGGEPGQ